jgi:hypothetical protein
MGCPQPERAGRIPSIRTPATTGPSGPRACLLTDRAVTETVGRYTDYRPALDTGSWRAIESANRPQAPAPSAANPHVSEDARETPYGALMAGAMRCPRRTGLRRVP